jgi:hypothetical protein
MHATTTVTARHGARRALAAGLFGALALAILAEANPAAAAGDPSLSSYLVRNPLPGWPSAPASFAATILDVVQNAADTGAGAAVEAAEAAWYSPGSNQALGVVLLSWPTASPDAGALRTVAEGYCLQPPATVESEPALGGSIQVTCPSSRYATVTTVAWIHGGILAAVVGLNGLPASSVASVAVAQDHALPSGLNPAIRDALLAAAAVAALLVVLTLLPRLTARRSPAPRRSGPVVRTAGTVEARGADPAVPARGSMPAPFVAGGRAVDPMAAPGAVPAGSGTSSCYRPGVSALPPYLPRPVGGDPAAPGAAPPLHRAIEAQPAGPRLVAPPGVAQHAGPEQGGSPATTRPGWYPIAGNRYEQAYFDGSGWIARKRWDGERWVDLF